jgi:hypothetical protein
LVLKTEQGGPSSREVFALARGQEGLTFHVISRPFEPGDPQIPFRVPLHPFDGGLAEDRLNTERSYAKANADGSWANILTFPPDLATLTLSAGTEAIKQVEVGGFIYILNGRYVDRVDPTDYTVTLSKDLGATKAGVDMVVFNGEIVVAMGETEKIWVMDSGGTWTQASDSTFAIALGVVGNQLYRAESTNKLSSCTTTPETLLSWSPQAPNQFEVGDSSYAVNTILEFGGTPWVGKGDGMYTPDGNRIFKNQTPQLRAQPHTDNCKGAFVAQGALWVPSGASLLRVPSPGKSKPFGPELTHRPDFSFWVRGGVEFGGAIYLLCSDQTSVEENFVCKMILDEEGFGPLQYRYHELADFDDTTDGKYIAISTLPTNPTLFMGHGANGKYALLGRGGSKDIDDANYAFGTALTLETGILAPAADLSILNTLVGVSMLLNYPQPDQKMTIAISTEGGTFINLNRSQEAGDRVEAISMTDSYESVTRYANRGTTGQFFNIRFTGSQNAGYKGKTDRAEIREAFAFGYSHPQQTDVIEVGILASEQARPHGIKGPKRSRIISLLRRWLTNGTVLEMELEDYDPGKTIRVIVTGYRDERAEVFLGHAGVHTESLVIAQFTRIDYGKQYASHDVSQSHF